VRDRAPRDEVVRALEQPAHGDELVQHDAEAEHVAPPIDVVAEALLGRHVRDLALHEPGLVGAPRELRDPEVDDLHVAVVRDDDVRGRDVAVHDAGEAAIRPAVLVRVVERRRGRERDRYAVLERHQPLALGEVREHTAQILAVHVLHREEVLAVLLADVVDVDDVVVVQRRGEARLVEEHLHEHRIARALVADLLDHDVALEAFDPLDAREDHLRHSAGGEVAHELVLAQAQPRCRRGLHEKQSHVIVTVRQAINGSLLRDAGYEVS
jgi:hypothetical protein